MGHQSCEALVPVAIGISIDTAVAGRSLPYLLACLAGLTALFTALTLCYRWFARFGQGAVIDESHHLRRELAASALRPGGARRAHGELLTIASSDADQASRSIVWLAGMFGAGAALAVSCGVLLTIDLRLGAVLIGTAVLVTLALGALSPRISRRVEVQQRTLAAASALATDLVTGLRVVHGLGAQRTATGRYREVSRAAAVAGIRAGDANALHLGASVLASTVVLAVSVAFAGLLALDGSITVGSFIAAVGAAQFIAEPLAAIGEYLKIGAAAKASAGRVAGVLDDAVAEDVWPGTSRDIAVVPGEVLGIVAEPAAQAEVVASLRLPDGGWHVEPHRPNLFAGSIAQNLALGGASGDPTAAIDAAGAREFVEAQPTGMDALIHDRGLSLSGGQRQRLALARALHTDPAALVLLEPTSAVDAMTEQVIAAGIRRLRHDRDDATRTTVVVTSSPALLAQTDRVVFVGADGPVSATHTALLDGNADYRGRVLA
jgi:putative ABC transport system ATP-binding protein